MPNPNQPNKVEQLRKRIAALETVLREALDEWENCMHYKGDHLVKKHGDREDLAAYRKVLDGEGEA